MNYFKQSVITGAMIWRDILISNDLKSKEEADKEFMDFIDNAFSADYKEMYDVESIELPGEPFVSIEYNHNTDEMTLYYKEEIHHFKDIDVSDWIDIQNYINMYLMDYNEELPCEDNEHIEVDSTWIKSFTYDKKSKVLTMKTLNDKTYTYKVSPELWNDLKECHKGGDSIGQFYNDYIKI